jgi:hypothetical protein
MIKKDKDGPFVEVMGEKFYVENIDETIDDVLGLINNLRQTEKFASKYDDEELLQITHKKILYYTTIVREIYEVYSD